MNVFCALSKETVYVPFVFTKTTITGIVHLDMLRQFLIPQADEDDQKDAFTSSKMAHPLITSEKRASTSTPVSQVGGLIERRRQHGHLVPRTSQPWISLDHNYPRYDFVYFATL
jgi:hypothetical protein